MAKPRALGPGATLGMLGGGQLGRMFGLGARRCGYQLVTYGDPADSPCGQISDASFAQSFTDWDALGDFAARVSVVTWEQENIPVSTVEFLRERVPVYPSLELLRASQHRLLEKTALRSLGIPTADFLRITSVGELQAGLATFGGAGILKTVTLGYDGKGQAKLSAGDDLAAVWQRFGVSEAILERIVDFDFELSIVCSRFADGSCHFFEPSLNEHVNHILDVSTAPSLRITAQQAAAAREMARTILQHFDVYGVLCVELFVDRAGHLLVNEIAPRPHNSGHLTIEACGSSQFEQQFRAVSGLPSGDVSMRSPAAMINLLGDHLGGATAERWSEVFAMPGVSVHMYGKREARTGRKMGHLTVLAESSEEAARIGLVARSRLGG